MIPLLEETGTRVLMKEAREDEQREQDEEKDSHIRVMNPLTLDFHVRVATTKIRTFRLLLLLSVPSAALTKYHLPA